MATNILMLLKLLPTNEIKKNFNNFSNSNLFASQCHKEVLSNFHK